MLNLLLLFTCLWMGGTSDLISRGKPTSQSSIINGSDWGGFLAVDGNYNSSMFGQSCFQSENDETPFLIIDLQGTFAIDHVVIYNRQDCCPERIIGTVIELLSQTEQVIQECGKITSAVNIFDIPCGNTVAQKVRVRGARLQNLQICELEVHGDLVVSLVSRGKPTYQSSMYGDMDGSLAVDGRYDNYVNKDDVYDLRNCFVSEQEEMPFFVVDLQGTFAIEYVILYNRADCCSERIVGAVVQLLYGNGRMSHECEKITESKSVYNISCGSNLAEKVRIIGAQNEYLQLCEVDVFGKPEDLPQIISRRKPTSESSKLQSLTSSLAVDGIYNSYAIRQGLSSPVNCFSTIGTEKRPFIEVDLQGNFKVNFVVLYNRMDCCSDRMIGVFVDLVNKRGKLYYRCGQINDTRATYNISCGNQEAYKVRVSAQAKQFLTICELDIFGESVISIISREKLTYSSSVYGSSNASLAVDGIYEQEVSEKNTLHLFHSKDGKKEQFWEVDLQGRFNIEHVVIYNRMDCCADRMIDSKIELLTKKRELTHECGKITEAKAVYKISCGGNVAQKVRIKGVPKKYLHFSEVDVYGVVADKPQNETFTLF